jgi:hypothetical protein
MQWEKQQMLRSLYAGTREQKLEKFAMDVTTWAAQTPVTASASHSIFILCPESDLRTTFGRDNAQITIVKTIELPKRPAQPMNDRTFGGGPGGGMPGPGGGFGPPGMPGPGGRQGGGGGGGGGGGMFGMQNLDGATWVLARWTPTLATPTPKAPASEPPVSEQSPATQPAERVVSIDVNR